MKKHAGNENKEESGMKETVAEDENASVLINENANTLALDEEQAEAAVSVSREQVGGTSASNDYEKMSTHLVGDEEEGAMSPSASELEIAIHEGHQMWENQIPATDEMALPGAHRVGGTARSSPSSSFSEPSTQPGAPVILSAQRVDEDAERQFREAFVSVLREVRMLRARQQSVPAPAEAEIIAVSSESDQELTLNRELMARKIRILVAGACVMFALVLTAIIVGIVVGTKGGGSGAADSPAAPNQTSSPTFAPTTQVGPLFATTQELYDAVDSYLVNSSNETEVAQVYGHPIGSWDVSGLTNISVVFSAVRNEAAASFNEDLAGWDLSRATVMYEMFDDASLFNGDISGWNVSSVTDTSDLLRGASSFNRQLSGWDVSSVVYMDYMFKYARFFNDDLSQWNVSSVTGMQGMFFSANSFNSDLSKWNVSRVEDMYRMFYSAVSFNGAVSSWDVSSVIDMGWMFRNASNFNGDIAEWDVSSVNMMNEMFRHADSFNGTVSGWDVSNVQNMEAMFDSAGIFNCDLSNWNVSSVENMGYMFYGAFAFRQNLCDWGPLLQGRYVDVTDMFVGTTCPNTSDPDLDATPPGPFCFAC